jgi:hypothetical protein
MEAIERQGFANDGKVLPVRRTYRAWHAEQYTKVLLGSDIEFQCDGYEIPALRLVLLACDRPAPGIAAMTPERLRSSISILPTWVG